MVTLEQATTQPVTSLVDPMSSLRISAPHWCHFESSTVAVAATTTTPKISLPDIVLLPQRSPQRAPSRHSLSMPVDEFEIRCKDTTSRYSKSTRAPCKSRVITRRSSLPIGIVLGHAACPVMTAFCRTSHLRKAPKGTRVACLTINLLTAPGCRTNEQG